MLELEQIKKIIVKSNYEDWDSLVINKRKPETHRLFRIEGDYRICLHKFYPCNSDEAFSHPHPWPATFHILHGGYNMELGFSSDLESEPLFYETIKFVKGSSYSMMSNRSWHKISPINNRATYTIMINGPEFTEQHKAVRRTKGKDLSRLTGREKADLLSIFKEFC